MGKAAKKIQVILVKRIRGKNDSDIEALFPGLREKVQEFIASHIHKATYGRHFEFGEFEVSDITTNMVCFVPKGADYEDLDQIDADWNRGLNEVGMEYEIRVALPHWMYEK